MAVSDTCLLTGAITALNPEHVVLQCCSTKVTLPGGLVLGASSSLEIAHIQSCPGQPSQEEDNVNPLEHPLRAEVMFTI